MSAITTLAPCLENSLAVAAPRPLAPPVISATFPSSLSHFYLILSLNFFICQQFGYGTTISKSYVIKFVLSLTLLIQKLFTWREVFFHRILLFNKLNK